MTRSARNYFNRSEKSIAGEFQKMSEIPQPDALNKLMKFIICLTILGALVAIVLYFAVELPVQQAALHVPTNRYTW
jgi:hypothetical protein